MNRQSPIALVVDDEVQIRRFLRAGFELEEFVVHDAATGAEGLRIATLKVVDMIIIDLGLPDMDGAEVRAARALVVDGADHRAVGALERGGEGAPARAGRGRLRGEAVRHGRAAGARTRGACDGTRAAPSASRSSRRVRSPSIWRARVVSLDGSEVQLSPKEYRLLQVLAQHAGNVVTHQHLLKEVWGLTHVNDGHYLRILVRKIRSKIERDPTQPRLLTTELGVGYRLAQ